MCFFFPHIVIVMLWYWSTCDSVILSEAGRRSDREEINKKKGNENLVWSLNLQWNQICSSRGIVLCQQRSVAATLMNMFWTISSTLLATLEKKKTQGNPVKNVFGDYCSFSCSSPNLANWLSILISPFCLLFWGWAPLVGRQRKKKRSSSGQISYIEDKISLHQWLAFMTRGQCDTCGCNIIVLSLHLHR